MKTITINLYTFDELSETAKDRARDWYREGNNEENYTLDEMMHSLKAIFKRSGIKLTNWEIGPYNQHNHVDFDMGDAGSLTGKRAFAWLENNLFSSLRITKAEFKAKQKEYMGYGADYRPGKIKPCPLTGMCYDENLLDALRKSVKDGDTLKEAFRNLADVCGKMNAEEIEYQNEDAQIDESLQANEYTFIESGKRQG